MLDERLDPQPGVDQRGHDLAEAVVPAVLGLLADIGRRVGVRALHREGQRLVVLPVRVAEAELAGGHALVLEHLRDRVDLRDEEPPARGEEMGDDPRPAADVGQPAEHATRGVDDVERPVEDVGQVVQVGAHEARVREAELVGERPRQLDGGRREVRAGDARPEPRPRQRVDPEMALQVEQRPTRDIADELDLVRPEPDAAGPEALEVVEVTRRVDRGPGVPQRLVRGERLGIPIRSAGHRLRASADRPGEQHVRRTIGRLAERHEAPGELADPGLLLARQQAQLVLDQIDPAPRDRPEVVVGDPGDRADPGRVDALDRPIVGLRRIR